MSRKNGGIIGPANTPVGGLFSGVAGGVWRMNDVLNFINNSQWPKAPGNIDNSLRFNDGSSDNLSLSVSGTSQSTTGTISFWFKRSTLGSDQRIFVNYIDANNYGGIKLQSDNKLEIVVVDGGSVTGKLTTTQVFRDVSAWYHCVVAIDSSNGTAGDRMRLYINGSEVTTFDTDTNPSSSATMEFFTDGTNRIGQFNSSQYFDGYLAEFIMIHGQQLTPSSFGETDSTTGIWKPKKIGSFSSAGDNSFYLDFKDSSNVGKDASGLSNNFTVNNLTSIDQSTDTCVENFCTLNPIHFGTGGISNTALSEGNLKFVSTQGGSPYPYYFSTMAVSKGKWYAEFKYVSSDSGTAGIGNGEHDLYSGNNAYDYSYYFDGRLYNNGSGESTGYSAISNNDILGCALDLDNNKIYFHINGSYQASGDPTNGTGGKSITAAASNGTGVYLFEVGDSGANQPTIECNFGNPPFSISSGNSDANGHGNFEYSVPSGYYALNTSNLNTYG